jgi:hypothetical protein
MSMPSAPAESNSTASPAIGETMTRTDSGNLPALFLAQVKKEVEDAI